MTDTISRKPHLIYASAEKPLQFASGYSLDLYCDRDRKSWTHMHAETFTGETFAECVREARKAGWKIDRKNRTATCPHCLKGL